MISERVWGRLPWPLHLTISRTHTNTRNTSTWREGDAVAEVNGKSLRWQSRFVWYNHEVYIKKKKMKKPMRPCQLRWVWDAKEGGEREGDSVLLIHAIEFHLDFLQEETVRRRRTSESPCMDWEALKLSWFFPLLRPTEEQEEDSQNSGSAACR